jgi:hypothetical protein
MSDFRARLSNVVMNGGICKATDPSQQTVLGMTPTDTPPAVNSQRTRVAIVALVLALFVCWSWCRRRQLVRSVLEPVQSSLHTPLEPKNGTHARPDNVWDDDPLFQPF